MAEMRVVGIGSGPAAAQRVLVLGTRQHGPEPDRYLVLWIGEAEAAAIEMEQRQVIPPRPATHQLIAQVIMALGHELAEVRVVALCDEVFHAELAMRSGAVVSARPSDAVAIALHSGVRIMATRELLDQAAVPNLAGITLVRAFPPPARSEPDRPAAVEEQEIERFRSFLESVRPEDFDSA
ncbi:bifunctional nuclease family protein [Pseudonocardia hispaniensis]